MPDWARHVRPRLSPLRLSPTREAGIVEELSQHLDDRWRELTAGGPSPEEATRLALAEFRTADVLGTMARALAESVSLPRSVHLRDAHSRKQTMAASLTSFLRGVSLAACRTWRGGACNCRSKEVRHKEVFMSRRNLHLSAGICFSVLVCAQTPVGWKELSIGPPTGQSSRVSPAGIESEIFSLRGIIAVAHGLYHPDHRITGPAILDKELMAVRAIPEKEGSDNLRRLLLKLLDERFAFKAHREQQPRLVLVLKQVSNRPGKLQAHTGEPGNLRVGHGTLEGSGPISALLPHIEGRVNRPVVDESGLQGTYRFQLTWEAGNRQSFLHSLEEQLGLVLSLEERSIEVLVVDKVEAYRAAP